ncbi:Cystathionine beta-lyase [Burkholderia lata]|uniref:Cystathionine beta-lyase n=1 Tax=Burkholderia lata (strain ATCC 17760 / DSM 23089 / LMG 22485 / NCIMB 9086 / R18194 / 383) TaxID=482957 RepID=A0A6P2V472_BURL3|nr:cystathionine beta-lyase [Burkholderia lata]VWC76669.1 Cystathionine beta-lyase [Burkholderia lata]
MSSHKDLSDLSLSTRMTLLGRDPESQVGFVNAPLYRGSTTVYRTLDDFEQKRNRFHYGTAGSPTIAHLEDAWTELTGATGTVLSPSGLGSIALALLSVVKAGDHILLPDAIYRPSRVLCNGLLTRLGIEATYYDPIRADAVESLIKPNTSVLFLESPGSQTMEVQDIPTLVSLAKRHGLVTILDNTWATPLFFDAHGHGIDISIEAGTKYLGGHSDLLLGLASANEATWPALRATYDAVGMLPGPEDCILALRGLRTLHLRLKEAERRALDLAEWCKQRPEVKKVLHPAFPDCPGHEFWKRDYKGSSGLFSILLAEDFGRDELRNMLDKMRLFSMGLSWGGYESLIIPFDCRSYRSATEWAHRGMSLRVQVGLEDLDDLKFDLGQGLDRLRTKA